MLTDLEIDLVLKDILTNYDYDFTYYSRDSLNRRIDRIYKLDKFEGFEEFRNRLKSDANYVEHFIDRITVNVTEMFRDFKFFKELKTQVLPLFEKRPSIRIWHAGCSTGEEVFSMAILLHEADLLHKSVLYGTDINHRVLAKAESGLFPVSLMQIYAKNYKLAGGEGDFSSYYTSLSEGEKFKDELRSRITFTRHNLASDGFLNKFDLIVCRNVLIYFDQKLQERVFKLFDDSTGPLSYLALGEKETISFPFVRNKFKPIGKENIWKKEM
jgi:chemotaxis protein methyltransferase CheR